jgi:hypothetical protein
MKHCIQGLKIALLVMFCAGGPLLLRAQEGKILDKPVKVTADHERLEDVLKDLAKQGYFTFSYQSDVVQKDRMVTITVREGTLKQALELILGKGFDYVESDDYVVIRREVTPKASRPRTAIARKALPRLATGSDPAFESPRRVVGNIIGDLVADGLIKDKESCRSFMLDNGQFQVDGKAMADSLRVKYVAKYIKSDANGYYFGPVSGPAHGYIFDKKDIYDANEEK